MDGSTRVVYSFKHAPGVSLGHIDCKIVLPLIINGQDLGVEWELGEKTALISEGGSLFDSKKHVSATLEFTRFVRVLARL